MKVGYTDGDTIERIAAQIGTSTPDKPVLSLRCERIEAAPSKGLYTQFSSIEARRLREEEMSGS